MIINKLLLIQRPDVLGLPPPYYSHLRVNPSRYPEAPAPLRPRYAAHPRGLGGAYLNEAGASTRVKFY